MTKRFIVELIAKYEGEDEAHTMWESFIKSLESTESFETFVKSLKDIKE
jgi:hypothetical protein